MSNIWPSLDEIDVHEFYLNDGDVERPKFAVKRRKKRALIDITIYESEFGKRRDDTRDFETDVVLEVCVDRYRKAFFGVVDLLKLPDEETRALKSNLSALFEVFQRDLDPKKVTGFWASTKAEKGQVISWYLKNTVA